MRTRTIAILLVLCATAPALAQKPQLFGLGPTQAQLFDNTVLQEIRLSINTRDWDALKEHFAENIYYACDLRWRGQVVRNVGIRSRGLASRSGVKPGLRVDFDRYVTDQTFLGLKSVVLRNSLNDPSYMHESLTMALFRRLGGVASREAYAKLYVNNDYVGLYTIVESIDKAFLARSFGADDGYLYQYDWRYSYYFEYLGADPALYVPVPFKPETHETDPRPEFLESLVWTINNTSDAVFRTAIADYLDLAQVIRHVAVQQFVAEVDGFLGTFGMANFYVNRFNNSTKFVFIPWDEDRAFEGGSGYSVFHNITDVPDPVRNRLISRILSYADLYQLYVNTLLACVQSTGSPAAGGPGWLESDLERQYGLIRDAALADPFKRFTNSQFEAAVDDLRAFARTRGAVVTSELAQAQQLLKMRRYRQSPAPPSRKD